MKTRDDVQSPAGPAVSIWVTTYNVPPAAVIIQTATGSDLGGLLLGERGSGMPYSARRSCQHSKRRDGDGKNRLRLEPGAGPTSAASWRGTVGVRRFDMGSSSRLCCKMGECLLRGSTFLSVLPCARMDHKGQGR